MDAETDVYEGEGEFYYSNDYIGYVNYAISRKIDNIDINNVADLVGHHVIAWKGAYRDLGPDYHRLFSPGAPGSKDYIEMQDSKEQVQGFWKKG
ncbi:hypothetical protein [Microbulbifer epialgicus]|uniref:Uncharacterized protein n=1 Tax=Microbulbifer epialgicus TaxID=393907 RepID=A0ABV4P6U0_9GAMM